MSSRRAIVVPALAALVAALIGPACLRGAAQGPNASRTATRSHPFVAQCFRSGKVRIVSAKGKVTWEYPARGVQDVWMLPNGNILFCHRTGAKEVTVKDKKTVWQYKAAGKVEIHSCQPLPNGNVLICECGTSRLIEVDRAGKIAREIKLTTTVTNTHNQFRMARKTPAGTYVVAFAGEGVVKEIDARGKVIRVIDLKAMGIRAVKLHGVLRLPNGNTLISTGGGGSVVEVDPKDKIVWQFTQKDLPAGFKCAWSCGIQRLPNGNTVISSYGGNPQFYEVSRDKKVVWSFFDKGLSSISGQYRLDVKGDASKGEILR